MFIVRLRTFEPGPVSLTELHTAISVGCVMNLAVGQHHLGDRHRPRVPHQRAVSKLYRIDAKSPPRKLVGTTRRLVMARAAPRDRTATSARK